jgi:hypothetical protein
VFPPLARVVGALERLDEWIDRPDLALRRETISAWSLGEQIDHVLKVAATMLGRLAEDGKEPKTPISLDGRAVLLLGWIPRGVGKAPEATRGMLVPAAELRAALAQVRELAARLDADDARLTHRRRTVRHPRFGGLTPAQALRFLEIHTRHHLKILRDIERA